MNKGQIKASIFIATTIILAFVIRFSGVVSVEAAQLLIYPMIIADVFLLPSFKQTDNDDDDDDNVEEL